MEAAHGPHGPSCLYEGQGRAAQAPDVLPPRAAPQGRQARRRGPAHVSTAGTYLHCGPAKSADDGGHFFVSRYCLINLSDDPITVDLDGGDPNEEVRIAEVWTLDAPGPDSRGESVRGGHCIPVFQLYSCCIPTWGRPARHRVQLSTSPHAAPFGRCCSTAAPPRCAPMAGCPPSSACTHPCRSWSRRAPPPLPGCTTRTPRCRRMRPSLSDEARAAGRGGG